MNLLHITGCILYFFLGIASFFWWSSQKKQIQLLDNILYSCAFIWTAIYITYMYLDNKYEYCFTFIFSMLSFLIYKSKNNTHFLKITNIASVIYINIYLVLLINKTRNKELIKSFCLLYFGILYKLNDYIFKFAYGTGLFHVFTSLGIYYLI